MRSCVCGRGRADVAALCIADHYKSLLLAVFHSLVIRLQSLDTELLIHGDLRLHGRNQIPGVIHDLLVEIPDGICRAL